MTSLRLILRKILKPRTQTYGALYSQSVPQCQASLPIMAATCVQRMPTLSKEKSDFELKIESLKDKLRIERSRLSDFELEEKENKRLIAEREKRALEEDIDPSKDSKSDALDEFEELQEARQQELTEFIPAPRLTQDDHDNNHKSLNRKMDQMLYLLVKQEDIWQLPQGNLEEHDSLLDAATRELSDGCGDSLSVLYTSNAPAVHHSFGRETKLFVLKALYLGGQVKLSNKLADYAWVTKTELRDYVSPDYYSSLSPALPD